MVYGREAWWRGKLANPLEIIESILPNHALSHLGDSSESYNFGWLRKTLRITRIYREYLD